MPSNAILSRMLDRLYASLVKGPCLNCRPHASRQRIDLTLVSRLQDITAAQVLSGLLESNRAATVVGRVPAPPDVKIGFGHETAPIILPEDFESVDAQAPAPAKSIKPSFKPKRETESDPKRLAWLQQKSLLTKLRSLADDARTYEQDTGVHALHLGFPLISLPPGVVGATSRVLAPVAFIPVSLSVRTGHKPGLDLTCRGEGIDLITPNSALIAWLERQTGKNAADLFADEEGTKPWEEIAAVVKQVCQILNLPVIDGKPGETAQTNPEALDLHQLINHGEAALEAVPRTEDLGNKPRIYRCAVLGLYPMANQSLLRDTQQMIDQPTIDGPVVSFVNARISLDAPPSPQNQALADPVPAQQNPRRIADERLVAAADPCQSRTVALARQARGLVIHGPPGTGKSQTITNIIGDHLARGERVLFVCEKRTALDVVANRLDHLGLGGLCALVHDPQRDQRDLYMAIRTNLDNLADTRTNAKAERELARIDEELQRLHAELTDTHHALMTPTQEHGASFHELMGQWLSIATDGTAAIEDREIGQVSLDDLDRSRNEIEVILRRGQSAKYPTNLWSAAAGISLEQYMARPAEQMRRGLASCLEDGLAADATRHDDIPPFNTRQSLAEQSRLRQELVVKWRRMTDVVDAATCSRAAGFAPEIVLHRRQQVSEAAPHMQVLRDGALNAELVMIVRDNMPNASALAKRLGALNDYLAVASRWHAFLHFQVKSAAADVLRQFGLPLNVESAGRLRTFLSGLRARLVLSEFARQWNEAQPSASVLPDGELAGAFEQQSALIDVLAAVQGIEELDPRARSAMKDAAVAASLLHGLEASKDRAASLERLETSISTLGLLHTDWLGSATAHVRAGKKIGETLSRLIEQFDSLEDVLRIRSDLSRLNAAFRGGVESLLKNGVDPQAGLAGLRRAALAGEIRRRLQADSRLSQVDSERIALAFDRYRQLEDQKRVVIRDVILHRWRSKQKDRLLASTGSRLNGEGAKLRQRLFVRGSRSMRLRQVIAIGADAEGGDPLFDLCPVWMASPETVAQIFPRQSLFDVVVFDEASQCKLEEALPVLTRAKRVVVAGDPKQLPPTRFFETSITQSDEDEMESDQDLFEAQQSEIEDLLTAALNLEIEESYLDVHYRSRNSDLIEFSNQQFYGDRLQPIPGHPANRTRYAPITLYRADGVYEDRCNPIEAKRICEIVRDLLKRAEPPSIGIACFNLAQRDLIVEMLDDLAVEDSGFASRLAEARERRGEGSFEGLFVKNLENVQGDERDHMIISTTYGRDPSGKFYRRFGPLGMPGGGRRLNVLVTRARHEVHLVTSIPREAYINVAPIPEGQTPNGGWLLFAYLRYAEDLGESYETNHRVIAEARAAEQAKVMSRPIETFSPFALALGQQLAANRNISSDVHWGNAGFRIDMALHHPQRAEDVTVGVLCDFAQYPRAQDPVEWDAFRTAIHESQGWRLHRLWTPQYFRDADKSVNAITRDVQAFLAAESEKSPQET